MLSVPVLVVMLISGDRLDDNRLNSINSYSLKGFGVHNAPRPHSAGVGKSISGGMGIDTWVSTDNSASFVGVVNAEAVGHGKCCRIRVLINDWSLI